MLEQNKLPKISVITVTYNSIRFVEDCIKSVINQNYPNLEYIIIDGGSTDGTIDIIKKYEEHISYWISEPDQGPPDAANKGVKAATGDLVNFLNSDDLYADNALFEVADKYKDLPEDVDIITCGVRIDFLDSKRRSVFYVNAKHLALNIENALFKNSYLGGWFFKRDILLNNPFVPLFKDGSIFITNDLEYILRIILLGCKNIIIPKALFILQSSSDSFTFSGRNAVKIKQELCDTALKVFDKTEDPAMHRCLHQFYNKSVTALILIHLKNFNIHKATRVFLHELKKQKIIWVKSFTQSFFVIIFRIYKRWLLSF